jgi:diamine N-acetyltransferase
MRKVPVNMRLRQVVHDDHMFLIDLHNDPDVLMNLTNPQPITIADERQLRLVFTVDDQKVGFTKFYNIDRVNSNCVLGADIHKDYRGKGYAKHMWNLMLNHCFNILGLHRVSLTTAEYNHIAYHLYLKLGFREEGKLTQSLCRNGKFYDQYVFFMLKEDWGVAVLS